MRCDHLPGRRRLAPGFNSDRLGATGFLVGRPLALVARGAGERLRLGLKLRLRLRLLRRPRDRERDGERERSERLSYSEPLKSEEYDPSESLMADRYAESYDGEGCCLCKEEVWLFLASTDIDWANNRGDVRTAEPMDMPAEQIKLRVCPNKPRTFFCLQGCQDLMKPGY